MCKKLLCALLSLWSASVWAADPWCSSRDTPAFSFEWAPKDKADPRLGSVTVKNSSSGQTLQFLDNVENYHDNSEAFRNTDLNNDGCGDLLVVSSVGGIGNESKTVFLYNPQSRRFVLHKVLSEIGGLEVDHRDKNCVTGSWKGGASSFGTVKHCWRGKKLVKQSEYSVKPRLGEDGNLQCYEHVATEYRAGKKNVKKSCTQEL